MGCAAECQRWDVGRVRFRCGGDREDAGSGEKGTGGYRPLRISASTPGMSANPLSIIISPITTLIRFQWLALQPKRQRGGASGFEPNQILTSTKKDFFDLGIRQ